MRSAYISKSLSGAMSQDLKPELSCSTFTDLAARNLFIEFAFLQC
jgi:hypothetical protein